MRASIRIICPRATRRDEFRGGEVCRNGQGLADIWGAGQSVGAMMMFCPPPILSRDCALNICAQDRNFALRLSSQTTGLAPCMRFRGVPGKRGAAVDAAWDQLERSTKRAVELLDRPCVHRIKRGECGNIRFGTSIGLVSSIQSTVSLQGGVVREPE